MRRLFLVTALVAGGLAAPAAGADEGTPCTFEVDVALSPGLSREPSAGTFRSEGESGTLDCRGDVGGRPVSGRGTFGADGRYGTGGGGDHCRSKEGRGEGTASFTVPVEGGSHHVDDPFTMTYRVEGRSVMGKIIGRRFTGTFDVTRANGDCLWNPVTEIRIEGRGHLKEDPDSSATLP